MAITDILKQYSSPLTSTTEDGRMLARSLAEIEAELQKLASLISFPEIRIPDLDTTGIEEAIKELKSGFPGPVAPQNLDLNPVIQTYAETQKTIKELLGEVKTTNHRVSGLRGGATLPSHIGIKDEFSGHKLRIDADGMLQFRAVSTPVAEETRFDYGTRTDGNPIYVGKAPQATPEATIDWKVNKFDYDSSARPIRIQTVTGAWSDRAGLGWS